jgi:hypothetical protein
MNQFWQTLKIPSYWLFVLMLALVFVVGAQAQKTSKSNRSSQQKIDDLKSQVARLSTSAQNLDAKIQNEKNLPKKQCMAQNVTLLKGNISKLESYHKELTKQYGGKKNLTKLDKSNIATTTKVGDSVFKTTIDLVEQANLCSGASASYEGETITTPSFLGTDFTKNYDPTTRGIRQQVNLVRGDASNPFP